jgi:uncharacterized membrane protein YfcA
MKTLANSEARIEQIKTLSGMVLTTMGPALALSLADQCMLALPVTTVMVIFGSMLGVYMYYRRSGKPEKITLILTDDRKFYHRQPTRKAA